MNIFFLKLVALCAVVLCLGCSEPPDQVAQQQIVLRDDLGREVRLRQPVTRVMALSPALTEMLFAVADTARIVAVTHRCDYPAAAARKPKVITYPLDQEGLLRHQPDLLLTEEGMTHPQEADRLTELGLPVYYFRYRRVTDVIDALRRIGELTGDTAQGRHVADSLTREYEALAAMAHTAMPPPTVLAITWTSPIYVHGQNTLMTDKIRLAGGQNAVTEVLAQPYPELTREYVLKLDPEVILGGDFAHFDTTFFREYPELRRLRAYRHRRIYATTDDLTARPGPRVLASVREIRHLLMQDTAIVYP